MSRDLYFQPIEAAHLPQCAALYVQVFNAAPWNENWELSAVSERLQDCLDTPGFYGLIVSLQGEPLGFALGYKERWDKDAHFYLKEMCVLASHQRMGIGAHLMAALEAQLKAQGVSRLYLYTARDTFAQSFCEKQGFYVSSKMIMMGKWLASETE